MTKQIGEILREIGKKSEGSILHRAFDLQNCQEILRNMSGMPCEAQKFDNGILTVVVDNSVSAQEITFRRGSIIAELRKSAGDILIKDIRVKISDRS